MTDKLKQQLPVSFVWMLEKIHELGVKQFDSLYRLFLERGWIHEDVTAEDFQADFPKYFKDHLVKDTIFSDDFCNLMCAISGLIKCINEPNQVVLSLSGGLDSTSLLMYQLAEGKTVRAFAFKYGQKHQIEIGKAQELVKMLQEKGFPVTLQVIDLTDVFSDSQSSLRGVGDIPEGDYREESMKSTVVENRNIIFSSIIYGKALGWAKQTGAPVKIMMGLHAGDHSIYPDCRPESQEMAAELFRISNWDSDLVSYEAPFININKDMVLDFGVKSCKALDLDWREVYSHTISCYNPDTSGNSCGKCGTCTERLEAFQMLGLTDPVHYQD